MLPGIITLLTDFGLKDSYVGIMKGVILGINPRAVLVDITHQIKPGNIEQAARVLREACSFFPEGSIHLALVDPGVGTKRRAIAVKSRGYFFVGPDNGLLWPLIQKDPNVSVVSLTEQRFFLPGVSHTFHGRDIFAPVAAHLSKGVDPLLMGPQITDTVALKETGPMVTEGLLVGRVIGADHFGNIMTNISRKALTKFLNNRPPLVRIGNQKIEKFAKTYGDVDHGALMALFGSAGYLEIAVNGGRADLRLKPDDGNVRVEVVVQRKRPA